jgi:hypothetical protein
MSANGPSSAWVGFQVSKKVSSEITISIRVAFHVFRFTGASVRQTGGHGGFGAAERSRPSPAQISRLGHRCLDARFRMVALRI